MTTAYNLAAKKEVDKSTFGLPAAFSLKDGRQAVFDFADKIADFDGLYKIFQEVVDEGQTYPQEEADPESFKAYFFSHNAFVLKVCEETKDQSEDSKDQRKDQISEIVGGLYLKPNFPGRSSHIANGGVIVAKSCRGLGVGGILFRQFVECGRKLGYQALYTNLVFVSNAASRGLCERVGFREVGRLPNAGRLKGLGYTDAIQYYLELKKPEES